MTFSAAFSQRLYFIYLQSEPEQPFFAKMSDKTYSSSALGYLILSRLRDSSYNFSIGFPENKWPEQKFTVDVKAKDHGYLLRNFGEKGWGLFDLQTLEVRMALSTATRPKMEQREVSLFTAILSKAANDPSLRESPVAIKMEEKSVAVQSAVLKEEIKPMKEPPVIKKDETSIVKQDQPSFEKKDEASVEKPDQPPVVKQDEPSIVKQDQPPITQKDESSIVKREQTPEIIKEEPLEKIGDTKTVPAAEYKRSVVTKRSESSTTEGFGLTFIDEYADGVKDTISIIIPNPKMTLTEIDEQPTEERKFLDVGTNETVKKNESQTKTVKIGTSPPKTIAKNNCSSVASENDFLKLRKKMAAERSDDGMVAEAKKYFKLKCFTVLQVKNLSALFLNDFGKYKFFDAAYTYVSDQDNFSSLSAELKDQYFLYRFKTILR
jgi:hypothetical protein